MKIAYAGMSTLGCKDELPNGCQGLRYCLKKTYRQLGHQFSSYFNEPDVFFFELNQINAMNIAHVPVVKSMKMFQTAKKIYLVIDDAHATQFVNSYLGYVQRTRVPFLMKGESKKLINIFYDFCENLYNNKFEMVLPLYGNDVQSTFNFHAKKIHNIDYSALHDYLNVYRPNKERKILSYSYKAKMNLNSPDVKILQNLRELECFKQLCLNRVCYMSDYEKFVPKNWVRNRYAQAYNANALVIGLKQSPFGDAYNISVEKYRNMTNDEFEELVKQQQKVFKEKTVCKQDAINSIEHLLIQ